MSDISQRLTNLGIDLEQLVTNYERELKELERIKKEGVIPAIYDHVETGADMSFNDKAFIVWQQLGTFGFKIHGRLEKTKFKCATINNKCSKFWLIARDPEDDNRSAYNKLVEDFYLWDKHIIELEGKKSVFRYTKCKYTE